MKKIFMILFLLVPAMSFALSKSEIAKIKKAQGEYLLNSADLSKDQSRICLEGRLELKGNDDVLTLGGTVIALDIANKSKSKNSPEPSEDGCEESSETNMVKGTLVFVSLLNCPADKIKNRIEREIQFNADSMSYKQTTVIGIEKTQVVCKLKKEVIKKSKESWKVEPEMDIVNDQPEASDK